VHARSRALPVDRRLLDHSLATRGGRLPTGASQRVGSGRDGRDAGGRRGRARVTSSTVLLAATIATILAVFAVFAAIGADAWWLAALGRVIVARHTIPVGVPFAAAPSAHWHNTLVLAALVFDGLERGVGDRGLMLAQLLAVGVAFTVLARDAREEGASAAGASVALLVAALGAFQSLAIARVQLFSLALFPVLAALLRSEERRPSRRIWLVVAVLALWANLHGAALIGLLVTYVYLLFGRFRKDPRTAVAVALAATLAVCLTPALAGTVSYYHGVLTNVAAQRGVEQWAPLSLTSPFGDLAILAAVVLGWYAYRTRPRLWEVAGIVVLAVLTIRTGRSSVWLLFFLVAPAARSLTPGAPRGRLVAAAIALPLVLLAFAVVRGPISTSADEPLVPKAVALAHGSPVLAPDFLAERVALDGGRVWLSNPLDAFSHHDQAIYLDWVEGRRQGDAALTPSVRVVLVKRGSATARLMVATHDFVLHADDRTALLYLRTRY